MPKNDELDSLIAEVMELSAEEKRMLVIYIRSMKGEKRVQNEKKPDSGKQFPPASTGGRARSQ